MCIGLVLLLAAFALILYNHAEAKNAEKTVTEVLPEIVTQIEKNREEPSREALLPSLGPTVTDTEMTESTINGYNYIGYLTIPSLELVLPIMADWDYKRLQIAPCRYTGTVNGENLVLMAHNYPKHFGKLSDLRWGESVTFTDMDGIVTKYTVVSKDVLAPTAVKEMTSGDFDLTLFTCTYGGKSRITVYCDRET